MTINNITNLDKFKKATYLTKIETPRPGQRGITQKTIIVISQSLPVEKKILNYSSLKTLTFEIKFD